MLVCGLLLYHIRHNDPFADELQNLCFLLPLIPTAEIRKENYRSSSEYLHRFLIETAIHATSGQPYEIWHEVCHDKGRLLTFHKCNDCCGSLTKLILAK